MTIFSTGTELLLERNRNGGQLSKMGIIVKCIVLFDGEWGRYGDGPPNREFVILPCLALSGDEDSFAEIGMQNHSSLPTLLVVILK